MLLSSTQVRVYAYPRALRFHFIFSRFTHTKRTRPFDGDVEVTLRLDHNPLRNDAARERSRVKDRACRKRAISCAQKRMSSRGVVRKRSSAIRFEKRQQRRDREEVAPVGYLEGDSISKGESWNKSKQTRCVIYSSCNKGATICKQVMAFVSL